MGRVTQGNQCLVPVLFFSFFDVLIQWATPLIVIPLVKVNTTRPLLILFVLLSHFTKKKRKFGVSIFNRSDL